MKKDPKTNPETPIESAPQYQPPPNFTTQVHPIETDKDTTFQYGAAPTYQPYTVTAQMNNNMQGDGTGQFLLRRPASTNERFIINFYPAACCGNARVFDDQIKTSVPPILAARGISNEQWVRWMSDFEKAMRSSDLSICTTLTLAFSVIGWPFVCYSNNTQSRRVQVVIDEINKELEPKGLFFKTQTAILHIDDYHEETSWIAISLHPDASRNILIPDVIVGNVRSEEEKEAHNSEKEDYFKELVNLSKDLGFEAIIWKITLENSIEQINQLSFDEIILNLCDGCDIDGIPGPSIAVMLEEKRFPYVVGCDSLFINNTLTKIGMKQIFKQHMVSTPPGFGCTRETNLKDEIAENQMTFPLFVKVSDSYGSVGIDDESICHTFEQLEMKCEKLFARFPNLTVEEFIDGPEYSVLISGNCRDENQTVVVYPPAERKFNEKLGRYQKFISYDRNWDLDLLAHDYVSVENKDDNLALQDLARRAYIAVSGNCYGRVDLRKRDISGKFYVLEVNASCGLGAGSSSDFILKLAGQTTQDFFRIIVHGALVNDFVVEENSIPQHVQVKIAKLMSHPSLAVVPNPVVHVICAAVLIDNAADPEGRIQEWGKDAAYVSELETIFRNIGYDPIVHLYHVDDIETVIDNLSTELDIVFNACLGSDGLHIAKLLQGRGFELTVGLNAQFFESSLSRQTMRSLLNAQKVSTVKGILFRSVSNITKVLHDMRIANISFPVYVKPALASRQLDGIHSGRKCVNENDLSKYLDNSKGEWVLEPFYEGISYRVLVAGDARNHNAELLVFPAICDQTPHDATSKQQVFRQNSFHHVDSEQISHSNEMLKTLNLYSSIDDSMLQMQLQDIARRAFVAVHGSCYGLVNVLVGEEGMAVVGVSGDVRFGEQAKASTVLTIANIKMEDLFSWLLKRPVPAA